jgi:hypothetical protein
MSDHDHTMGTRRRWWAWLPWLAAAAVLGVPGCNEADPLDREVRRAKARFMADSVPGTTTSRYVTLQTSSQNDNRITLDVVVHDVSEPVTGIALKITYPNDFSKFVSCSDGDLFPAGSCLFSEPGRGSGEVFLTRTVADPAEATTVTGSQVILRAKFLVFGKGGGEIVFEGRNLGGSDASALLDVAGQPIPVEWYAGTLLGD